MTKPQRGSLLSSIVMVMLATVATGLLAFIGFQALPDSVIPTTFGGNERSSRHVNVSDSPSPRGVAPTSGPATPSKPAFPSATANPHATAHNTRDPQPVNTGGSTVGKPTSTPKASKPTTSPKPVATTSAPKPSPSASQTTQTPSPAPTCGTGRKPRCPRAPSPESSPSYSGTVYSENSYAAASPKTSSKHAKSAKPAKAAKARKHTKH